MDTFHKGIQYGLEKLGKSKCVFHRTAVSNFKGSANELVDYSRAPCLVADQRARGLWERDCYLSPFSEVLHFQGRAKNMQSKLSLACRIRVKKFIIFIHCNSGYICAFYIFSRQGLVSLKPIVGFKATKAKVALQCFF